MLYTKIFGKTRRDSKKYDSANATYLIKAGFIDQVMAGTYTYLTLGLRVLNKIENIIREEINTIGTEIFMPTLAPLTEWEKTGRLETVDVLMKTTAANNQALAKNDTEYVLSPTHEETVTPLAQKFNLSYKDFPFALYHIQTKFRNEPRVKSGLLRGREFRMKDLYSFHTSVDDMKKYYENSKKVYTKIFERLGIGKDTVIALASGGSFTEDYSHEFQTICESGEDTLYFIKSTGIYYNKEVADKQISGLKEDEYDVIKAAEVGNIFPLYTKFSDAFGYKYTDVDGKEKPVYMGCYGIGPSRIMGIIVEKFNDEKGILWPEVVAPFQIHLIGLDLRDEEVKKKAFSIYELLTTNYGLEVLFDDRLETTAGNKFSDADLIGIPVRLVVSKRTGEKVEYKKRNEKEAMIISIEEVLNFLKNKQ